VRTSLVKGAFDLGPIERLDDISVHLSVRAIGHTGKRADLHPALYDADNLRADRNAWHEALMTGREKDADFGRAVLHVAAR
jgi:hypothetical protein